MIRVSELYCALRNGVLRASLYLRKAWPQQAHAYDKQSACHESPQKKSGFLRHLQMSTMVRGSSAALTHEQNLCIPRKIDKSHPRAANTNFCDFIVRARSPPSNSRAPPVQHTWRSSQIVTACTSSSHPWGASWCAAACKAAVRLAAIRTQSRHIRRYFRQRRTATHRSEKSPPRAQLATMPSRKRLRPALRGTQQRLDV